MATQIEIVMSGEIKNAANVEKYLTRVGGDVAKRVQRAVGLSGEAVKAKAQDNLSGPILNVQTGHLRASILVKLFRAGLRSVVTVGSPVIYGAAHEVGTRFNEARHWLKKSFEESVGTIRRIFIRGIEKGVRVR